MTVKAGQLRRTKLVQIGSGFLSQHSKELLFGLGKSEGDAEATIVWPSGLKQTVSGLPINRRVWIEEGKGVVRTEPFHARSVPSAGTDAAIASPPAVPPSRGTWLYEPFPAPDFSLRDLAGQGHSLSGLAGRPVVLLFWATTAPASRTALEELARGRQALAAAGATILAVAVDPPGDEQKVRAASQGLAVPVMIAGEEVAGTYAILSRYLFDRREGLRLPTVLLLNGQGEIAKVYRDGIAAAPIAEDVARLDAPDADRLARAVPFAGTLLFRPADRNYFQYGLDLSEQGFDGPALGVFERVAKRDPSAITFYNLGTLYMKRGQPVVAKGAFERALEMKPDYADASNSLGALLAQSGDVPGAIERFRAALQSRPEFPDALNNLGFALFQNGQPDEAYPLYEKALKLQPGFPEALNNLGIFHGRRGDIETAQRYFQQAVDSRPGYGEAGNNLALVLAARGDAQGAVTILQRLLQEEPAFEMTYVTLARIYLKAGQRREGIQVLERLLQRNPKNPLGLELLRPAARGAGGRLVGAAALLGPLAVAREIVGECGQAGREHGGHLGPRRVQIGRLERIAVQVVERVDEVPVPGPDQLVAARAQRDGLLEVVAEHLARPVEPRAGQAGDLAREQRSEIDAVVGALRIEPASGRGDERREHVEAHDRLAHRAARQVAAGPPHDRRNPHSAFVGRVLPGAEGTRRARLVAV